MTQPFDNSSYENKVIVIEPTIKSSEFRDFLVESTIQLLETTGLRIQSIRTEGCFIILRLCDPSLNVIAIDILKKTSGISFIFFGVAIEPCYDTIVNTVFAFYSNSLISGKTYFIHIKSASMSWEDEKPILDQFDLEFHLNNELSSKFAKSIRVDNDKTAEIVIYILLSGKICYISMLSIRGQSIIPLNYLQDAIVCPIFDNVSLISLVKVLNSGYIPIPLFFFSRRDDLKRLLKAFENIISAYPIDLIEIYLISIENQVTELTQKVQAYEAKKKLHKVGNNSVSWLIFRMTKSMMTEDPIFKMKMVELPLTPYAHPRWLIRDVIENFRESGRTIFTPLLFNNGTREFEVDIFELTKKGFLIDYHGTDIEQQIEFNQWEYKNFQKEILYNSYPSNSKVVKKIVLRVRKDDILDIFNSI